MAKYGYAELDIIKRTFSIFCIFFNYTEAGFALSNNVVYCIDTVELQYLKHLWTMEICSRHGQFDSLKVNRSA